MPFPDFPNDLWSKYYMSTVNDVPGDPTIANGQDYNDVIDEIRGIESFVLNTYTDNALTNGTPVKDTTGWLTYADGAAAAPTDGSGGSPSIQWNRVPGSLLSLKYSFSFDKPGTNCQGQGVASAFTLPAALTQSLVEIEFEYRTGVGYTAGDLRLYILDLSTLLLRPVTVSAIPVGQGRLVSAFTATTSTQYRLIFHIATTSTSVWSVTLNRVRVGRPYDQPLDPDLRAVAELSSLGFAVRTNTEQWAVRTLVEPLAGLTIANPDGTSGNPTFALANDLAALEGLAGTGYARRTGPDTWVVEPTIPWSAISGAPSGAGGTYLNPDPVPATVGGITAGTTFPTEQTMQQMFDALLYPYQAPAFNSFDISGQSSPLEVGATIPASVTFTWTTANNANITPSTILLRDVTNATVIQSGLPNTGSYAATLGSPVQKLTAASHVFRIEGTNTQSTVFTRDRTFQWLWRLYHGTSVASSLSGADIGALTGSVLTSSYARTYSFAAGGYKYICQAHAAGGQLTTVKDQLTGFSVPMATSADGPYTNQDGGGFWYALVAHTNAQGVLANYRVYRTKFVLGGAISLVVT